MKVYLLISETSGRRMCDTAFSQDEMDEKGELWSAMISGLRAERGEALGCDEFGAVVLDVDEQLVSEAFVRSRVQPLAPGCWCGTPKPGCAGCGSRDLPKVAADDS